MEREVFDNHRRRKLLIIFAWFSILMISDLPDILCKFASGEVPLWMFWGKTGFMIMFLLTCLIIEKLRLLLPYAFVMLVFYLALSASEGLRTSAWWMGLVGDGTSSLFSTRLQLMQWYL